MIMWSCAVSDFTQEKKEEKTLSFNGGALSPLRASEVGSDDSTPCWLHYQTAKIHLALIYNASFNNHVNAQLPSQNWRTPRQNNAHAVLRSGERWWEKGLEEEMLRSDSSVQLFKLWGDFKIFANDIDYQKWWLEVNSSARSDFRTKYFLNRVRFQT